MVQIVLSGASYNSYASVSAADEYLAADAYLYASWEGLTASGAKERALISATRYLENLSWKDGVPSASSPAQAVTDATIIFAANIAVNPRILDTLGSGANIRRVRAGSAEVEFFTAKAAEILPSRVFRDLRELLNGAGGLSDDEALSALTAPFDGGAGQPRCKEPCKNGLNRPYS